MMEKIFFRKLSFVFVEGFLYLAKKVHDFFIFICNNFHLVQQQRPEERRDTWRWPVQNRDSLAARGSEETCVLNVGSYQVHTEGARSRAKPIFIAKAHRPQDIRQRQKVGHF